MVEDSPVVTKQSLNCEKQGSKFIGFTMGSVGCPAQDVEKL